MQEKEKEEEEKGSKPTALTRGCARPREDAAHTHLNTFLHLSRAKIPKNMYLIDSLGAVFAIFATFDSTTLGLLHIHNKRCKDWKLIKKVLGFRCAPSSYNWFVSWLSCVLFEFFFVISTIA